MIISSNKLEKNAVLAVLLKYTHKEGEGRESCESFFSKSDNRQNRIFANIGYAEKMRIQKSIRTAIFQLRASYLVRVLAVLLNTRTTC